MAHPARPFALLVLALLALTAAGCGNHPPGVADTSAAALTSAAPVVVPSPPAPVRVSGHGELIALANGELGIVFDGEVEGRPLGDASAVEAAGGRPGLTLTLSGIVEGEAIAPEEVALDDVAVVGRLRHEDGMLVLLANDGRRFAPEGALASALLAEPLEAPLLVTGRITAGAPLGAEGLAVTSWRAAVELRLCEGRVGRERWAFVVEDVASGRYRRVERDRAGRGRLSTEQRAELTALLAAAEADLRAAPPPSRWLRRTRLELADRAGSTAVEVDRRRSSSPALVTLADALERWREGAPTLRPVRAGDDARVTAAGVAIARTDAAARDLARRALGRSRLERVRHGEALVAAFLGAAPAGASLELRSVERVGDDLYVEVSGATEPHQAGGSREVRPYAAALLELAGAEGRVFVGTTLAGPVEGLTIAE